LVSEVTCGDPAAPEVAAWALTNRHRRECVQQELEGRLDLPSVIADRALCAASQTVERFEKILYTVRRCPPPPLPQYALSNPFRAWLSSLPHFLFVAAKPFPRHSFSATVS